MVNNAPGAGFFGIHEMVAVQGAFDHINRLVTVLGIDFVQAALGPDNVLGMALNIRGLTSEAA